MCEGTILPDAAHFFFLDEPLPWVHQDIIDYIGSHLTVRAGVVDNLNKDANNYIVMHLDLTNSGDSLIQKGRWKLYFTK